MTSSNIVAIFSKLWVEIDLSSQGDYSYEISYELYHRMQWSSGGLSTRMGGRVTKFAKYLKLAW